MTLEKVRIVRLLTDAQILHLQKMFCKQAFYPGLILEELYKQQDC